jgi:hypothetical protein
MSERCYMTDEEVQRLFTMIRNTWRGQTASWNWSEAQPAWRSSLCLYTLDECRQALVAWANSPEYRGFPPTQVDIARFARPLRRERFEVVRQERMRERRVTEQAEAVAFVEAIKGATHGA